MFKDKTYCFECVFVSAQECHKVVVGTGFAGKVIVVCGAFVFSFSYGASFYNVKCIAEFFVSSPALNKLFEVAPFTCVKATEHWGYVGVVEGLFVGFF